MNILEMTRKDFENLPDFKWGSFREREPIECDSLVILPLRTKHDSGYRHMDFVGVRDGEPIGKLSGFSDVIHLDGIGGYGHNWLKRFGKVPSMVTPSGWNIDCLPKSGLLQIWPGSFRILVEPPYSSFEIYALPRGQ